MGRARYVDMRYEPSSHVHMSIVHGFLIWHKPHVFPRPSVPPMAPLGHSHLGLPPSPASRPILRARACSLTEPLRLEPLPSSPHRSISYIWSDVRWRVGCGAQTLEVPLQLDPGCPIPRIRCSPRLLELEQSRGHTSTRSDAPHASAIGIFSLATKTVSPSVLPTSIFAYITHTGYNEFASRKDALEDEDTHNVHAKSIAIVADMGDIQIPTTYRQARASPRDGVAQSPPATLDSTAAPHGERAAPPAVGLNRMYRLGVLARSLVTRECFR